MTCDGQMAGDDRATPRDRLLAQLADHLDLLGLGTLVLDRSGRVVDADPVAQHLLGRSPAELLTVADVSILLAPEERFKRTTYRERRRRGELGRELFRTVVLAPDGGRRPVEAAVVPLGDGVHTGIVVRDLSEEATLDQTIDWYASLVERMPIGVVVMDASGVSDPRQIRMWSVNEAASKAAGRDLTAFVGRPLADVFPWARRFDEAQRALSLRDTGAVEHFPDFVIGDPDDPTAVYRRTVVALPEGALALLLDDITRQRADDVRQRQLAERLVAVGDTERREIAMGIHDDPIQQIAAASLLLGQLRRRSGDDERAAWLDDIDASLRRATASLRDLVFELAPPELVESGLASAVASAVDHLFGSTAVHVDVEVDPDIDRELATAPDHAVQTTAFRIIAEALTNARKHADATHIAVTARIEDRSVVIGVADDGAGWAGGDSEPGHLGLRGMRDRAAAIGGALDVRSGAAGTSVRAVLPIDGIPVARPDDTGRPLVPLPDPVAVSLRLELDSVRASAARYAADAEELRGRWGALAELRATLDALPPDPGRRAAAAAEMIGRTVRDACAIRLATSDGSTLRRVACWHPDPAQLAYLEAWVLSDRSTTTSHPALIYRSQQPLLLDRTRFDWWLPSDGPEPPQAPVEPHHAIGVPIRSAGRVRGVLTVVRDRTPEPLQTADIDWVWALTDVVAAALDR